MSKPLEFYQLERPPFEDGARDASAVGTRPLRAGLERARRFIETESAVVCVKGRAGIGKTYLGLALPGALPPGTLIARLCQPAQPWSVLHAAIAKGFELDPQRFSVDALRELRDAKRRLVIEIDPVEQLEREAVAPLLSLLSHAYLPGRRLVQAVLFGDFAALPAHAREGLARLGSATLELEALPDGDVPSYVQKRLERAGYRGRPLFSRPACEAIRRSSEGVPREINRICARALELGALRRAALIEPELIREACAAPKPAASAVRPADPPAPEPAPRAVIGQLRLETRSVQAPSIRPARPARLPATRAGQARRIEPLPPEPVVQAEPETPLLEAVFVDDEPRAARAMAARPAPREAIRAVAPESTTTPPALAELPAAPSPEPPEATRTSRSTAPPATSQPEAAALEPPPRVFPWRHVALSLAASWALAGGAFWIYAQRQEAGGPVSSPAVALAAPTHRNEPAAGAAPATVPAPEAEPALPPSSPPTSATPAATSATPSSPGTTAGTAPAEPALPEPEPRPAPAPSAPATQTTARAPTVAGPAAPRTAPAPPPPLRVELRARGRELLYPPRPASAYATPAQ